jgi:hypothetical protein
MLCEERSDGKRRTILVSGIEYEHRCQMERKDPRRKQSPVFKRLRQIGKGVKSVIEHLV